MVALCRRNSIQTSSAPRQRLGWTIIMLLFPVACLFIQEVAVLRSLPVYDPWINDGRRQLPESPPSQLCSHAVDLFGSDESELWSAINLAKTFHTQGGNLRAIQEYLDGHIQSTLNGLDVQFTFHGDSQPTQNSTVDGLRNYYQQHKMKRGGYGQPLPGTFQGRDVDHLIDQRWVDVVEPFSNQRQTVAIGPIGPSCRDLLQLGSGGYETKYMCGGRWSDSDATIRNTRNDADDCHLFSIGSNDQWEFESAVRTKFPHCQSHTFDCTLQGGTPKRKPRDDNVHFYDYCIGQNPDNPKYVSYEQLYNVTNIQSPPRYLKMDIEGFEYQVLLESVLAAPRALWPEQIMVETHWSSRMVALPWLLRQRQAAELSLFYAALFNHGGYLPVYAKNIKGCTPCMEVLLIRVLCN